ncbi:MAG: flagellar biosynthetic protein FliO [Hoeflea sp.]|uniref:flagellar biosynthetic protein FliO n=1 Tax=Hoeflea sp. TaxID=1940281 RepID=UPI001D599A58|nr:flagellar biosynthetic protein FliO [Hoeflea sp.]MBU4530434.1 flagellar biosynthetic protein FliO [Alphaproteobacteria bacterium]MBU4545221.1 flagellar biosynthetic protein FliO [Alphaproteobacteria bacterium]MBU4549579.1 flagellar biosynthetic protein FliO [Alphaproteobacteria bacterium]MBV1722024.1 flagellar biosynthetic protein FliO [Hoeflea sp.]MBV1761374.1 flagellar biosynthetic protein FliO [Hoeflea sp.]
MPDNILGGQGATLLTAIVIVAVALLALVGVFWVIRARASSTFIRGGKNRQPRLAVLDATAVDTRRRLVLIRRDDVEHLVMIGGPTDIVIESRIVHPADDQVAPPPRPKAAQQKIEPQPERIDRPAPAPAPAPAAAQRPAVEPRPQPQPQRPEQVREPGMVQTPPQPSPAAPAPASRAAMVAPAAAASVGSIRAEASDVLESARARVFEEPSFDDVTYDELISAPEPQPRAEPAPRPAPAAAAPAPAYAPPPAFDRATGAPAAPPQAPRPAARPVAGDFESVLAAELSGDLSLDETDDGFFEPLDDAPQPASSGQDPTEAPEVKPDSPPSRDSLEAEMERLLGDLSRKP